MAILASSVAAEGLQGSDVGHGVNALRVWKRLGLRTSYILDSAARGSDAGSSPQNRSLTGSPPRKRDHREGRPRSELMLESLITQLVAVRSSLVETPGRLDEQRHDLEEVRALGSNHRLGRVRGRRVKKSR